MKVYTSTFDLAHPNNCRFWAPQHSDFKIGVKIAKDGEDYAGDFSVKAGGETLTPDADKTAGFTTFTAGSAGPGVTVYEIDVPAASQKFYLMQVATASTVFEVGGSGGGDVPADMATKTWVNSQISDFVDEDALTAYAEKTDLTAYYTKSETSSAAELSGEFTAVSARADEAYSRADGAYEELAVKVDHKPGGTAPEVANIETYYEWEYAQLSVDDPSWAPDVNTMYVILPDQA